MHSDSKIRCGWVGLEKTQALAYQDKEWGVPVHDDRPHAGNRNGHGSHHGLLSIS